MSVKLVVLKIRKYADIKEIENIQFAGDSSWIYKGYVYNDKPVNSEDLEKLKEMDEHDDSFDEKKNDYKVKKKTTSTKGGFTKIKENGSFTMYYGNYKDYYPSGAGRWNISALSGGLISIEGEHGEVKTMTIDDKKVIGQEVLNAMCFSSNGIGGRDLNFNKIFLIEPYGFSFQKDGANRESYSFFDLDNQKPVIIETYQKSPGNVDPVDAEYESRVIDNNDSELNLYKIRNMKDTQNL